MGCDIHLYVEKRVDGRWIPADEWYEEEEDVYDDAGEETGRKRMRPVIDWTARFYTGRNYSLFAILANVRNGRGFAGCDIGDGFNVISEPRGLPEDVCDQIKAESDNWGCDGHSHSWLTVCELLDFDWDQISLRRGVVERDQAIAAGVDADQLKDTWLEEGEANDGPKNLAFDIDHPPESFSVAVFGPNTGNRYVNVQWKESYRDCCPDFLQKTLPRLQALGKPENVRIVFFFDN